MRRPLTSVCLEAVRGNAFLRKYGEAVVVEQRWRQRH